MIKVLASAAAVVCFGSGLMGQVSADVLFSDSRGTGVLNLSIGGAAMGARTIAFGVDRVAARPALYQYNGRTGLIWLEGRGFSPVRVVSGRDINGNGTIDGSERTVMWDARIAFPGASVWAQGFSYDGSRAILTLPGLGIVELVDSDGDGEFSSPGETSWVIDGSFAAPTVVAGRSVWLDPRSAHLVDGRYVYYDDALQMVVGFDPAIGLHEVWLNYGNVQFPRNPDVIGGLLPVGNSDLALIAVDRSTAPSTTYLAFHSDDSAPYVYQARDLNSDGDVQDPGEVTLFVDGLLSSVPVQEVEAIDVSSGSVYLFSYSAPWVSGQSSLMRFADPNGNRSAMDAGEQTVTGTFASSVPDVDALTAIPATSYGPLGCAEANISSSGISSAGGMLFFTVSDIPLSRQGGTDFCVVGVSGTLGGSTPIAAGCRIGLGVDALTMFLLSAYAPELSTPTITGSVASTRGLPVAPGLTPGIVVEYAGLFVGPTLGATDTQRLVVQ